MIALCSGDFLRLRSLFLAAEEDGLIFCLGGNCEDGLIFCLGGNCRGFSRGVGRGLVAILTMFSAISLIEVAVVFVILVVVVVVVVVVAAVVVGDDVVEEGKSKNGLLKGGGLGR